jgi:hypothetical protein
MRSFFACGFATILSSCLASHNSVTAEGLCLLQTKAAKHGRSHHADEIAQSDNDVSVPPSEKGISEKTVLLSSSSGAESDNSDDLSHDKKLQGITDLEAYGGSMMDLVLGGWRHSHENPSKKSTMGSPSAVSSAEVVRTPSATVAPVPNSISKQVVDAFGDPIRDMDVDLLSTAPARVRSDPILEDVPPVETAESGPSEEPADKVLAEAQKSLEAYSAVLSETEKISLLGKTADESESHQTREESAIDKSRSHQHHEVSTGGSGAHHVVEHKLAVQQKALAMEHFAGKKIEAAAQKTVSTFSDAEAHLSKAKFATASGRLPVRQQTHPHAPTAQ